jgi:hypothetical protein
MTRAAVEDVPGTPGAEAAVSRREGEGGCGAVSKWLYPIGETIEELMRRAFPDKP